MKKLFSVIACLPIMLSTLAFAGCDDAPPPPEIDPNRTVVDYDLTETGGRTALMNYGILTEMLFNDTAGYIGKTVRVQGFYFTGFHPDLEREVDALSMPGPACQCPQVAVLQTADGVKLPEPDIDRELEIVGTFGTFTENGFTITFFEVDEVHLLSR